MDRMACVDIAALPLQLLLRRNPEWGHHPVAVVDHNKPQGRILWVNERARKFGILPGMSFAAAHSLSGVLRADEVPLNDIERSVESILQHLRDFTPNIEPVQEDPGAFWLDASGLEFLYDSLLKWARHIRWAIRRREELECTVVVGFTKFWTYAAARTNHGVLVFREPHEEERTARRAPLGRLTLAPVVRDTLYKLGIKTIGDFADLPPEGIERRFGKDARRFHRLARGELQLPLESQHFEQPLLQKIHLDYAEMDLLRLVVIIGRLLDPLLKALADRDHALAEMRLDLRFESGGHHFERIRPAAPTLDLVQLTELIHLRLASTHLPDGVTDLVLIVKRHRIVRTQLEFFTEQPPRNLDAANRALARLRAEFGDDTVVRARLREGHLPEALFSWEPLPFIRRANPGNGKSGVLVRRLFSPPVPLPARPRHEPDGWMLRGLEQGPVVRVLGPYIISGGWWHKNVHREYHFAETQKGELLWAYYDRFRRRWFIQGRVE